MSQLLDNRDVKYVRETSGKAMGLMIDNNVVPSPSNYQVWYDYTCEGNLALCKVINEIIKKKQSFTSKVCNNLYERFFSNNQVQNAVTKTGQGIQNELSKIAIAVSDINKETTDYGVSLTDSLRSMEDVPGSDELKSIVSALMTETKDFSSKNSTAELQLKESSKTIQKLQRTLNTVRQESLTDMLTNIGNRKSFEENLASAIKVSNKKETDLCLVIGDIDYFKKFNDKWGHHVGDQVLKAVAHSMKTRVGSTGSTARYGGEEFVILLPEQTLETTLDLTETIRSSIAGRNMKRKSTGENIGKITCSFGVAKYRQGEHRNEFIERADAALYKSKSTGRNKISIENDEQPNVVKIA